VSEELKKSHFHLLAAATLLNQIIELFALKADRPVYEQMKEIRDEYLELKRGATVEVTVRRAGAVH